LGILAKVLVIELLTLNQYKINEKFKVYRHYYKGIV